MFIIRAKSAGYLWKNAVTKVWSCGNFVTDKNKTLKELLNIIIEIENPIKIDKIITQFGNLSMIKWMDKNFLDKVPINEWGYSYGQRMVDFGGINQIQNIKNKLLNSPDSKSATITLMDPPNDKKHMPCICILDFKVRKQRLFTSAFFRSQDAGTKIYADILSIGKIIQTICKELNLKIGPLTIFIASLHIYLEDKDKIPLLKNRT